MTEDSRPGWDRSGCAGGPWCPSRCPRFVDAAGRPLLIRPFELCDLPSLAAMYADFGPRDRSMGLPPRTERGIDAWLIALAATARNVVAVTDRGRVVGHVVLTPAVAMEPELAVFVRPGEQGRGIGTELVKHAIARAADAGRRAITLAVERSNGPARSVYRGLGFEITVDQGSADEMRLCLADPIADRVRLPPAATA